jgi:4-hydroxybenzoate polyprenyltransferase
VLGVVLMRSAGCVINDFADRRFDAHVERTRDRPIAAGRVSPREALLLFALLCLIAFAAGADAEPVDDSSSPSAAVLLAAVYPVRQALYPPSSSWCWARLSVGRSPWLSLRCWARSPRLAWLLFTVNILWSTAYDTFYAMADRDEDLKVGVKSTAILFGESDRLVVGVIARS